MEWQDISSAPRDGTVILAANTDMAAQNPTVIYWDHGSVTFDIIGHWRTSTHESCECNFTHWMPLPNPPETSE